MGTATMKVPTEFSATDKFTSVVSKMTSGVSSFTKTAAAAASRVNQKIDGMFSSLNNFSQLALGLGAAGLFSMAVQGVMDYETALHSLEAVTGKSASTFEKQIEGLAVKNKKSVIDVAKSFEVIGSAMSQYLDNPEALEKITQAGITLAKASRQELEPTLENLTSVMNQFKLGAEDADKVINTLTAGEIVGSVSTAKIAQGLQEFGANAYTANVKLSESVALLETLGKQMDHSKIAVGARNLLGVLSSAKGLPKEATESLKSHGVSLNVLMDKTIPLGARLKELSKIQGDSVAITKVFGKENSTAANVIFSNLDTYTKWEEEIKKTNKASEQAAINSATLGTKIQELKDSFINAIVTTDESNTSLSLMENLLGWIGDNMGVVVTAVASLALAFAGLKAIMLITTIWTFLASVALGVQNAALKRSIFYVEGNAVAKAADTVVTYIMTGAIWLATAAMTAFNFVMGLGLLPILAIIAAIAAIIAIFYYWDEIVAWFGKQWETFTSWIGEMWDKVVAAFTNFSFTDFFMQIGQSIIDFMLIPLKSVLKLVSMIPGGIGEAAQAGLDKINELSDLGINVNEPKKIDSPEQINAKITKENRVSGGVEVNIRDRGGNVDSTSAFSNGGIPVKVGPTQGAF